MSDCLDVEISNNHQRWRPSPCFQRTLSFAPSFPLHFLLACLSAAASLPILKIHSSWCQVIEGIASWRESRTNATLISSINYSLLQHHSFLVRFGDFSLVCTDIFSTVCARELRTDVISWDLALLQKSPQIICLYWSPAILSRYWKDKWYLAP